MKFTRGLKRNLLQILLFFLVSLFLTVSWFRFGYIYGGGDVGLQVYNPIRILEIVTNIWWEATGPGSPTPQGLTAIPFNYIFSALQLIGFNPLMLQSTLFFTILFTMGVGMYLLILFLFNENYKKYAVLGGLFYMFNPYMMIQVWHRFVHSTFFISAALPFLMIFWIKWIKSGKPLPLLIFLIINLVSSYAFGTIAYILTLWSFLLLIIIPEIIFPWSGLKNTKRILCLFLIGFSFWILTDVWWLLPIFKIAPSFLSEQHSNEQTLATIYTLGYQTVLPYSLQMINPFYLFSQLDFGSSYLHIFLRIIPWIFVTIIFVGLIKGLSNPKSAKWSIIYLLVLILSKGVASPFGYIYVLGMTYFFPLGVLRNPFEKMGVLLPLVSSLLLVIGTKIIFDSFKDKLNIKLVNLFLLIIFFLILSFCWPMFTGQIFGKIDKPEFVEVPKSYTEADLWIKSDYSKNLYELPGKILHLPLTKGESISYNWEHGYSGLESSALFFTSAPSISHGFNLRQVDNSLTSLYQAFHKNFVSPDTILRLLQDFNVRYIVLHKDVKWQGGEFYDPKQTEAVLNNLSYFDPPKKIGDLIIYKISDQFFKPKISLNDKFILLSPPDNYSIWPWILAEDHALITDLNKNGKLADSASAFIFPKKMFAYEEASASSTLLLINQLVSNPDNDNLWLTSLLNLKTIYRTNNEIQGEQLNDKLISASKRILKIARSIFVDNKMFSPVDLDDYAEEMRQILFSNSAVLSYYAKDKTISNIFQVHLYLLRVIANKIQTNGDEVVKIADELKKNLIQNNFISTYYTEGKTSDFPEKTVLKFEIPKDANYELLITDSNKQSSLANKDDLYTKKYKKSRSLIDGKPNNLTVDQKGDIISLGSFFLTGGVHEIDLPVLYSDNLLSNTKEDIKKENVTYVDNDTLKIESAADKISYLESKIGYVRGEDSYKISFSIKVEKGNGFYIQLVQDTDSIGQNNQINYQVNEFINQSPNQDFTDYSFSLPSLRLTTKSASIRFLTAPPDNGGLTRPSILLRKPQIVRLLDENIFLRDLKPDHTNIPLSNPVKINQKTPSFYEGKFHIEKPTFIIFSESYHPNWKLTLTKENKEYISPTHYLANLYSNAWYIKDAGNYSFKLEFEPQNIVKYSFILAVISYLGLITYYLIISLKMKR